MNLLLVFLMAFMSCKSDNGGQSAATKFESAKIEGKVNGYTSGNAYLVGMLTGKQYIIDTTAIQPDGSFTFAKDSIYQQGMVFVMMPDNQFFPLLLSGDQQFKVSTQKGRLQEQMQVEGSVDNQLYFENVAYENQHKQKVGALDKYAFDYELKLKDLVKTRKQDLDVVFKNHPNTLFTKFKLAGQNPEIKDFKTADGATDTVKQVYTYRTEFWNDVDFSDERLLYTPVISNKANRYINELTAQNPDSIIAAADFLIAKVKDQPQYFKYFVNYIALNAEPAESKIMDADAVYAHMLSKYFTKEQAFWSNPYEIEHFQRKASEMQASLVGNKGPNVTAKDINGQMKSIYEIQSDYIIVFMYSPSCDHCIEQSPKMVNFYKQWRNKNVEVYGIGVDTNQEEWEQFVRKYGLDIFTNVYDPTNKAIYKKYYVDITPEVYVLNKDREIIGKNLDVEQIATIIERDKKKN